MHERGDDPPRAAAHLDLDRARAYLRAEILLSTGGGARVVVAVGGRRVAEALRRSLDPVLPQIVARACPWKDDGEQRERSRVGGEATGRAGMTVPGATARRAPVGPGVVLSCTVHGSTLPIVEARASNLER
jgi:hypothetical protein